MLQLRSPIEQNADRASLELRRIHPTDTQRRGRLARRPHAAAASVVGSGRSPSMRRIPRIGPSASALTTAPASAADGAIAASADAGTMATSPGSSASNAGTRAFSTRTQPTSRASCTRRERCRRRPPTGTMADHSSPKVAMAGAPQVAADDAGESPTDADRAARPGRPAAARTRARSRRSGPTGRRSASSPSAAIRAQTRRRGR